MSESDIKDTPEQAEFRQHCRDWLSDNTPDEPSLQVANLGVGDNDRRAVKVSQGLAEISLRSGTGGL